MGRVPVTVVSTSPITPRDSPELTSRRPRSSPTNVERLLRSRNPSSLSTPLSTELTSSEGTSRNTTTSSRKRSPINSEDNSEDGPLPLTVNPSRSTTPLSTPPSASPPLALERRPSASSPLTPPPRPDTLSTSPRTPRTRLESPLETEVNGWLLSPLPTPSVPREFRTRWPPSRESSPDQSDVTPPQGLASHL